MAGVERRSRRRGRLGQRDGTMRSAWELTVCQPWDVCVYSSSLLLLLMVLQPLLLLLLLLLQWEDKSFVTTASHSAPLFLRWVVQFQSLLSLVVYSSGSTSDRNRLCVENALLNRRFCRIRCSDYFYYTRLSTTLVRVPAKRFNLTKYEAGSGLIFLNWLPSSQLRVRAKKMN